MATKRNYNKMSAKETETVVEATPVEVAPVETPTEKVKVTGVVSNCDKLNVRKASTRTAEVVHVVDKNTEVTIDDDSNPEFYKVRFKAGRKTIVGYCMKKYISVKK